MEFREALNETIRVFRLKAVDISEASGVNEQEISRYRKGHKDINSSTLHKIVNALPRNARAYFLVLCTEEKEPVKTA